MSHKQTRPRRPPPPPNPYSNGPVSYEVKISVVDSSCVLVEARLLYLVTHGSRKGELTTDLSSWISYHPSRVYARTPCWLFRILGDTLEKRIQRAERSVSKWAEAEVTKYRRLYEVLERGNDPSLSEL